MHIRFSRLTQACRLASLLFLTHTCEAKVIVVPAAANTAGQNNSYFRTKLDILPLGTSSAFYITLQVLPSEGQASRSAQVLLTPGRPTTFPNVLEFLGYYGGAGIEILYPENQAIAVVAEVYADGPNGRYSTAVVPLDVSAQGQDLNRFVTIGIGGGANTRVNVGCAALQGSGRSVEIEVHENNGSVLGTISLFVPASGWNQIPLPYLPESGYIVWKGGQGSLTFCYAVNVNNQSNDGTYLR